MGKKNVSSKKLDTTNNGRIAKRTQKCHQCLKQYISHRGHFCGCKSGIVNIGNSCYISSVLQAVAELGIFANLPEDSSLFALLQLLNSSSAFAVTPDLALFELRDLWTHENLQEDAFDFFLTILPLLQSSKFTFEFLSQRLCEICHYTCEAVVREDCSIHMAVDGEIAAGAAEWQPLNRSTRSAATAAKDL